MQVEKAAGNFYTLQLTEQQVEAGFVIGVHSKVGSRFKLLLFETTPSGQWELLVQA